MKLWIAVHALSVARLDTAGLRGAEVIAVLQGKVLAWAAITGLYSFHPAVPV